MREMCGGGAKLIPSIVPLAFASWGHPLGHLSARSISRLDVVRLFFTKTQMMTRR
jgi:hypothetical protein